MSENKNDIMGTWLTNGWYFFALAKIKSSFSLYGNKVRLKQAPDILITYTGVLF